MDEPYDITGKSTPEAAAARDYIRRRLEPCEGDELLDFEEIYEDYCADCENLGTVPMQLGAFVYYFALCENLGAVLHRTTREKYYSKIAFKARGER